VRPTIFSLTAAATLAAGASAAAPTRPIPPQSLPTTPIEHVIVVVGENVSFDTLFATYQPRRGEVMRNLLSQRIINTDGTPGTNYGRAVQYVAQNRGGRYEIAPLRITPYALLPQPTLIGSFNPLTLQPFGPIPDPRFAALRTNGPFQLTTYAPYSDPLAFGTGDPVHRFFQMWQQNGGDNHDLRGYAWTAITTGQGGDTDGVTVQNPGQGGELMGFYNMATGDAPYFKTLADRYATSDNYHQAIQGGTGANFFMIATGDVAVYNQNGRNATPPDNQIEDPNPRPGTANFFQRDGYSGGSYVRCADPSQPGVLPILLELAKAHVRPNCAPGTYYLVNNYNPPYDVNGQAQPLGPTLFVYPPQSVPTIGESLSAHQVSWRWYTAGRDTVDVTGDALYPVIRGLVQQQVPVGTPSAIVDALAFQQAQPLIYNNLGDPHIGSRNVATGPLRNNLRGLATFYNDVAAGTLPSVSWVVPKNLDSGHPGYSVSARYESFVEDLVNRVQANPALWRSTAIIVTTDEGGGYFDSGRIQNLDFFGDGPRIPLFVISPYARAGHVDHVYSDHASVLKFIERNWRLPPLSSRSRDRLKNPVMDVRNELPINGPAIGDLMGLFTFGDRIPERDN